MNSNWFFTGALLSLIYLCGCRTAHHSPVESNHPVDRHATTLPNHASHPLTQSGRQNGIHQVGYLKDGLDDADAVNDASTQYYIRETAVDPANQPVSDLEPQEETGLLLVEENKLQNEDVNGQTFTLAELEEIAIGNNPAIAAANLAVAKSTGLLHQVGTLPNPTIGYSGNQLADQATDQHTVFIEQELVRGNKLDLNRQVYRHTTEAQRWEIETQRFRILSDVRIRFYEAMAAQKQLEETTSFAKIAGRGLEIATDLKKAGEGTLIDVLQSRTLLSEIELALEQAQASYRGAWEELTAIAGVPDLPPTRLLGDFESSQVSRDWDETFSTIIAESPELAAANALVCEKRAFLNRQRVQAISNVTAQIAAGYDRSTDSGLINLQLGVPIPVRNKNCGNISAAHADYVLAVENVNRIRLAIKSRLARAVQAFEKASATVRKYEQEILPQVSQSLEISEKAYSVGELSFLQVLVVRRTYYDSNIRYIQAKGKLAQTNAAVDGWLLTGGLDAPQDYTSGLDLRDQSFGGQ